MKPIIIANWKMNLNLLQANNLAAWMDNNTKNNNIIISPPAAYLSSFSEKYLNLELSCQNISLQNKDGAYTGELSASILKSCGVNYAIIGHSERRSYFNETNAQIKQKAQNCFDANITPIICVGESEQLRKKNTYKSFLKKQILESIPNSNNDIIIAYEPIWSIGTGTTPTLSEIEEIAELILTDDAIRLLAKNIHVVYGGSVNSSNFEEICSIKYVDGVLIGGASLKTAELERILK